MFQANFRNPSPDCSGLSGYNPDWEWPDNQPGPQSLIDPIDCSPHLLQEKQTLLPGCSFLTSHHDFAFPNICQYAHLHSPFPHYLLWHQYRPFPSPPLSPPLLIRIIKFWCYNNESSRKKLLLFFDVVPVFLYRSMEGLIVQLHRNKVLTYLLYYLKVLKWIKVRETLQYYGQCWCRNIVSKYLMDFLLCPIYSHPLLKTFDQISSFWEWRWMLSQ